MTSCARQEALPRTGVPAMTEFPRDLAGTRGPCDPSGPGEAEAQATALPAARMADFG